MKYRFLFSLVLCLLITACTQTPPSPTPEPPAEPPTITVAPIEGDAVSPDGKWEVVQDGGNEGITSGGLYPCETVKIVNRDSGEVLWEEDGAYLLHAAWPEGSEFAIVARTARTWTQVTVISTETGATCPVRLPGDEPIPEYTFLAEDWIGWTDENTFELRLDGGDGTGISTYWCSPVEDAPRSPLKISVVQPCHETLPGEYDFTHDGQPEKLQLITVAGDAGRTDGAIVPLWYELHILNDDGESIWSRRDIALQHVGWGNFFKKRLGACAPSHFLFISDIGPRSRSSRPSAAPYRSPA